MAGASDEQSAVAGLWLVLSVSVQLERLSMEP